ncbi:MAG TPA: O-antigen ligase family protein [Solirubrobacteraceae bacterium]|nr:O-antigen ligase family protein [Solirubrobacteraceae bacterium]
MALAERLLISLLLAAGVVYATTPYAIRVAGRFQFYDKPRGYKGHAHPTPYLGGAAVMSGFVLAMLLLAAGDWQKTVPLLGGVALLWIVGTIDDRRTVSPGVRVVVELALAGAIWASGLGWDLHLGGAVDLLLTCLWILAVVNAFNLFDNMDGAASMMALVVCAGAATLGVVSGDAWLTVGAASLGGACLGFLPRNLSLPARIFLGDGGSMPLGFAVAVLVMIAATTSVVAWQSLPVAFLLVGIPALDTSLVIVSRRRRGVSILTGGRDHLTHRARRFLPSARAVALALGAVQAIVSVLAVLASEGGTSFVVIGAILYLLAAAIAIAVLDTQQIEEFTTADPAVRHATATVRGPGSAGLLGPTLDRSLAAHLCLIMLGLGAGLSPFLSAYYDASAWVPIGLGLVGASAVGVVARPARPSGPAALALGGLLGVGVWSLASTAWAESVENAVVSGNRWLAYGALLLTVLVLLRGERRSAVLLGAAGLGVAGVAVSVLARLLGGDPGSLFLGGRLNSPLGYINGEGCVFAMGFWLCFAAAESRRALLAGPAAGLATLMACLTLLSQSRGTALAMLGSLLLVVALVPGRTRRLYGLLVVAGGVALAAPELLRVYDHTTAGSIPHGAGHAAGRAALLAAVAAGGAWALLTWAWELLRAGGASHARFRGAARLGLAAGAVLALVMAAGSAHRIEHDVSGQWRSFTHLAAPSGSGGGSSASASQSRLLSGAGNRYDYWRVAWRVSRAHPLLGVGAGNYPRSYYQRRATTEDVAQPHSVELQTLSELGLVGALLLAGFIGGVAWGAARMRRAARRSPRTRALMVGGLGVVSAWLVQTSADWMHLLPGLTAIALLGAAVLLSARPAPRSGADERSYALAIGPERSRVERAFASRPTLALGASAVVVTLVVAGASLGRQGLADIYRARAQNELHAHPAAALSDARRSLDFDADAVSTYYVKAAALARYDQGAAVEAALRRALAREPENFVTWALLGDVAVREGRLRAAKRDYARAHRLNPRNLTLTELSADPAAALR